MDGWRHGRREKNVQVYGSKMYTEHHQVHYSPTLSVDILHIQTYTLYITNVLEVYSKPAAHTLYLEPSHIYLPPPPPPQITHGSFLSDSMVFFLKDLTTPWSCWECCSSTAASFCTKSTASGIGIEVEG